ncbi:MAG: non-ribosomal peptide synthetase, partial [Dermatophilaceae bacterium]
MNDVTAQLAYTQESLWLLDKISGPDEPVYNESLAFWIDGGLQPDAVRQALAAVVARHEALRTVFTETSDGLRAIVRDAVPEYFEVVDLGGLPDPEQARDRARELVDEAYRRPFDLAEGPLLRALVIRVDDEEHLFGLTVHHIVADGWSLGLILDELGARYAAEPAPKYSDYVRTLRATSESGGFDESLAFWKETLQDSPQVLKLPLDRPRPPARTFRGATRSLTVPRSTVRSLVDLCRRECGSTESAVLIAVYALLMHRLSGQDKVTIGTTVLNRADIDQLETVGCFVNTTALVFDFGDPRLTFRHLLERTGDDLVQMLEHQAAPFPKVLESLDRTRDPSHSPVFQTMMTLLGRRKLLELGEGLESRHQPVTSVASKFDLLLYVTEDADGIEFEAEFATDLFEPETVERILRRFVHTVEHLADDLDAGISRVPILPQDEKELILGVWNDTEVDYPDSTVIDMIEAQAARTPDAPAVEFHAESLTYRQLNSLANRIAHRLQAEQHGSPGFVGVYMERSIDMVAALLAVMKAGLAYVPIDPGYPAERVRYMIEDCEAPLILTQENLRADLDALGVRSATLAELDVPTADAENPARSLTPDSRAYMIYTSGSTGRPKGVVNRHVSLFNRLFWMQSQYPLTPDDRVLQKTPFSFDVSVWEFFWPLMVGAGIVVAEPGGHQDPEYLRNLIHDRGVTTLHFVPSMLNVFLEERGLAESCSGLRRVFCSGEALQLGTVEKFSENLSCGLHNLYGPT